MMVGGVVAMLDVVWLLVSASLVFLMQAGFLCLESGRIRSKNSINVAAKNISDFIISSAVFNILGFYCRQKWGEGSLCDKQLPR